MEEKSIYPSYKRKKGILGFRIIISRSKKMSWKYLLSTVGLVGILGYMLYTVPPSFTASLYSIKISIVLLFFILALFFLFSLFMFLTGSKKHASLLSLFIIICLVFLLYNFTQPFFFVLLAALFFILEILFIPLR
jgi:hypothetical protein